MGRRCSKWVTTYSKPTSLEELELFKDDKTSQVVIVVKNPPANAGDKRDEDSIPGSGRSPRGGNGNPFQYSYLENPMDRGAWQLTVHGVAKSRTRLSNKACTCTRISLPEWS